MFFTGHHTILAITILCNESDHETWKIFPKHIKVSLVKISAFEELWFVRYTLWNIGLLTSPETSLKQVFQVNMS